jgi:hypothetical protein
MTATIDTDWGPLAEPIHSDAAGPGDPIWKDNAYIAFWDVPHRVVGVFHVSTSPNDAGSRRARCSINVDGNIVEIIEELQPGTFKSDSIDFGLDGRITVRNKKLDADLINTPLFTAADYSVGAVVPELVPGKPLQHFQRALDMTGTLSLNGVQTSVAGKGMRDRTWGFRDEAAMWVEYIGIVGVVGDTFITVMKFLGANGDLKTDGFIIDAHGARSVPDMGIGRDAAGLFRLARLRDGDSERLVTMTERLGGFFVPMGKNTEGPGFGTYDDFVTFDIDGVAGAGFIEQGIVHRVH